MTKTAMLRLCALAAGVLAGWGLSDAWGFQLEQRPAEEYIERMERPTRVVKVNEVIEKLRLKPGDIVADIGSGSGTFSIPMAKAIAPNGVLYAVDIDQKMLDYVAEKARKEGVTNLRTVLGEYEDPKLPVQNVDVAFYHRTLHMIEKRQAHLNNTAKYLKPDGRIVVIDKNREDSPGSWMWLNQSDVDNWMAALSFYPAEKFGVFDDRYFVVYQRPYGNSVLLKRPEGGGGRD
ncbi:MAG TPA: methyltransferase domain-containing protein [Terriglobia bacterium]|nr:methyltransferase domain-containing protein [Terriglobia bacterium]